MSFFTIFNPFTSGYLYGVALSTTKDDVVDIKNKVINHPIITTVDVLSTGCVYALTADLTSKVLLPEGGKNVLTGVLFAVAGYKLYKFIKKTYRKPASSITDDLQPEAQPEVKPEVQTETQTDAYNSTKPVQKSKKMVSAKLVEEDD